MYLVNTKHVVLFCVLQSIILAAVSAINILAYDHRLLPEVHRSAKDNACIKVVNYENGHAFNCQDVNVVLRRYRTVMVEEK